MKKRILALLLAVVTVVGIGFSIQGCGNNDKPDEEPGAPATNTPVVDFTKKYTSDELRQVVVDFMREQLTVKWHTNVALTNYRVNASKYATLEEAKNYAGMRYSYRGTGALYNLLNYYNRETELLDMRALMKDMGINPDAELNDAEKEAVISVIANHCSGAAYWAWSRVTSSVSYQLTDGMLPYNGCIALVTALKGFSADNYLNGQNTLSDDKWKDMIQGIGKTEMLAGYEKLKPGDGLTNPTHSIMVVSNDTVNKKIVILEQGSTQLPAHTDGYTYQVECAYKEFECTYEKLYTSYYLPYTIDVFQNPDLINTAERQPALTTNQFTSAMTVSQVMDASVDSNYPISYVRVDVVNSDRKVVKTFYGYTAVFGGMSNNAFNLGDTSKLDGKTNQARAHQSAAIRAGLESFADGNHTLNVSALIGTGHMLGVMNGITLNAG